MASTEERQQKLAAASEAIEELASIDADSLARRNELSPKINFSAAVPRFKEMLDIVRQLNDRDISRLSSQQLDQVIAGCKQLQNLVKQVRDFDLNQNTPADVCNSIVTNIANAYDNVMNPLLLPLAFTATQATDYAKIEREAKGCHATIEAEAAKLQQFMESCRSQADAALAAVKAQAAEAGVATNAHIFQGNATKHATSAVRWLKATVVVATVTILTAVAAVITVFFYQPATTPIVIQYVVAKVILLSTLSFAILLCGKNYKAHKHNETLDQHRANALMTFRAFIEGTSDPAVKDAILLHAAQAAFTPRPTAFDSPEKDSHPINPIVEVLGKNIAKANG